jgi:hypothetical protein
MLAPISSLLIPLALTTGLGAVDPSPSYHHDVRAFVTGYNTVPGQTDSTPCIGASGVNICGRRDAVACPRRISLGTIIEIRGETYVCEDRLAKKYDDRFDISCDKDMQCPYQVAGWVTIKVYDVGRPQPADAVKKADNVVTQRPASLSKLAQSRLIQRAIFTQKIIARAPAKRLLAAATEAGVRAARRAVVVTKPLSNVAARLLATGSKTVSGLRGTRA